MERRRVRPARVETVMTEGNGFLLDRRSRPRRQKPIRRNSSTADEDQREVALLVFRNGRYRIAIGSPRIMGIVSTAHGTAPVDNAGTKTVWAYGRMDHRTRPQIRHVRTVPTGSQRTVLSGPTC